MSGLKNFVLQIPSGGTVVSQACHRLRAVGAGTQLKALRFAEPRLQGSGPSRAAALQSPLRGRGRPLRRPWLEVAGAGHPPLPGYRLWSAAPSSPEPPRHARSLGLTFSKDLSQSSVLPKQTGRIYAGGFFKAVCPYPNPIFLGPGMKQNRASLQLLKPEGTPLVF